MYAPLLLIYYYICACLWLPSLSLSPPSFPPSQSTSPIPEMESGNGDEVRGRAARTGPINFSRPTILSTVPCRYIRTYTRSSPELVLGPGPPVVVPEQADDGRRHQGEDHDGHQDGHDHRLGGNYGKGINYNRSRPQRDQRRSPRCVFASSSKLGEIAGPRRANRGVKCAPLGTAYSTSTPLRRLL